MDFLRDLNEGRMTRDESNQKTLTYNDCCEKFYLIMLVLEMMREMPYSTHFVQNYCRRTKYDNFKHFKISGTDAYNLLYFLNGDEHALGKLKDPEAAQRAQASTALPLPDVIDYFAKVANGNRPFMVQQMFLRLENGLHVNNSDYKEIRRSVGRLNQQDKRRQKAIATRLLFAARAKLRNSDIIEDFEKLIHHFDLESQWQADPEPTVSKPDIVTTSQDLTYYRLLAKPENLILIKNFLQNTRDGKAIPSNMVRAYAPVAEIMDDIVTAGPTYINMLKSLQKRAKKQRNKKF